MLKYDFGRSESPHINSIRVKILRYLISIYKGRSKSHLHIYIYTYKYTIHCRSSNYSPVKLLDSIFNIFLIVGICVLSLTADLKISLNVLLWL